MKKFLLVLFSFFSVADYANAKTAVFSVTTFPYSSINNHGAIDCKALLVSPYKMIIIDHCLKDNRVLQLKNDGVSYERIITAYKIFNHLALITLDEPVFVPFAAVSICSPIASLGANDVTLCAEKSVEKKVDLSEGGSPYYDVDGRVAGLLYSSRIMPVGEILQYASITQDLVNQIEVQK